jgi:hypothetical protein
VRGHEALTIRARSMLGAIFSPPDDPLPGVDRVDNVRKSVSYGNIDDRLEDGFTKELPLRRRVDLDARAVPFLGNEFRRASR